MNNTIFFELNIVYHSICNGKGDSSVPLELWKCSFCSCHKWIMPRNENYRLHDTCPFCENHIGCKHNNITKTNNKIIKEEWWYANPYSPKNYTSQSTKKVQWICKKDPYYCHLWKCSIKDKLNGTKKCPGCYPSEENNNFLTWRKDK